ncbi:MAG TPA: flagellar biosynthesis anti-sigma factor FlgM [Methylococcales bacterium]
MSNLDAPKNRYAQHQPKASIDKQLDDSRDMLAEELLNNITATPIGRLLRQIAEMPEIRQDKVSIVRNKINRGEYDLNEHLDLALDRVLEELIT